MDLTPSIIEHHLLEWRILVLVHKSPAESIARLDDVSSGLSFGFREY